VDTYGPVWDPHKNPYPTCTHSHGYGFLWVWVRVRTQIPGGYPCHSLSTRTCADFPHSFMPAVATDMHRPLQLLRPPSPYATSMLIWAVPAPNSAMWMLNTRNEHHGCLFHAFCICAGCCHSLCPPLTCAIRRLPVWANPVPNSTTRTSDTRNEHLWCLFRAFCTRACHCCSVASPCATHRPLSLIQTPTMTASAYKDEKN
jgi:hypothetical protein